MFNATFADFFLKDCVIFETMQTQKYDTLQLGIQSHEVGLVLNLCTPKIKHQRADKA